MLVVLVVFCWVGVILVYYCLVLDGFVVGRFVLICGVLCWWVCLLWFMALCLFAAACVWLCGVVVGFFAGCWVGLGSGFCRFGLGFWFCVGVDVFDVGGFGYVGL